MQAAPNSTPDTARVTVHSPPRPDSPTSPTISPPPARDAPIPPPLQRPLTRSRSSLAHTPTPCPAARGVASPPFPSAAIPGSLAGMYEHHRMPSPALRGVPLGAAAAGERVCDVFGASPSFSTLRAGHAGGWLSAAQDARIQPADRRSASGSLVQEAVRKPSLEYCCAAYGRFDKPVFLHSQRSVEYITRMWYPLESEAESWRAFVSAASHSIAVCRVVAGMYLPVGVEGCAGSRRRPRG